MFRNIRTIGTLTKSLLFIVLTSYSVHVSCCQNCCAACGTEPASQWYQENIRAFSDYLHIKEPITIYKLDLDKKPEAYAQFCLYSPQAIWINERYFERYRPSYKLWHLAKQMVTFSRHKQVKRESSRLQFLLTIGSSIPAVVHGVLTAASSHYLQNLQSPATTAGTQYDCQRIKIQSISHALTLMLGTKELQTIILYELTACTSLLNLLYIARLIQNSLTILHTRGKENDREIYMQTAHMLLDLGHDSIVEEIIKDLGSVKVEIVKQDEPSSSQLLETLQVCILARRGHVIQISQEHSPQQVSETEMVISQESVIPWYKDKAHEFLGYLHVQNPQNVPVYTFSQQIDTTLAHTGPNGIGINQAAFKRESEVQRIFTIAHEAAHYALQHVEKGRRKSVGIYRICQTLHTATPIAFLFSLRCCHNIPLPIKFLVGACLEFGSAYYAANRLLNSQDEFNAFVKSQEKEADLHAAAMLCEHGYHTVVERYIKELTHRINAGNISTLSSDHPSLYEKFTYLRNFIQNWKKQYPEKVCRQQDTLQWQQQHQKLFLADY